MKKASDSDRRTLTRADVIFRGTAAVASLGTLGATPRRRAATMPPRRNTATAVCPAATDWPGDYDSGSVGGHKVDPPGRPSFTRDDARKAGRAMAEKFVKDRSFAEAYLAIVKQFKSDHADHTDDYKRVVMMAYPAADYSRFNAHDFANVHHATWLVLLQAFACLVDVNPHDPDGWGDPPACTITRGDEESFRGARPVPKGKIVFFNFHNVPNSRGMYAVNTGDFPPPPL